ncbi:hypothetical protein G6L37_06050 [Agrobacterium rubi]|nr:hypothetical protein [Agrobacterium rubi]NTF24923.1 hypothetical protein [Agrobacterium rubi]
MSDTMFTVTGQGLFPSEMLIHDNAVPATKADGDAIAWLMSELDDDDPMSGEQTVALLLKNAPDRSPDAAAWEAAGWKVTHEYVL